MKILPSKQIRELDTFTIATEPIASIDLMERAARAFSDLFSENFKLAQKHNFAEDGSQIDFSRMKEGGMDAMFFAVYVGQGKRTPEGNAEAKENRECEVPIFLNVLHGLRTGRGGE